MSAGEHGTAVDAALASAMSAFAPDPAAPRSALADLQAVDFDVQFRLRPLLRALEMLADSQRVLSEFSAWATYDKAFSSQLGTVCPTWNNPTAHGGPDSGLAIVTDLAGVAVSFAEEIAESLSAVALRMPDGDDAGPGG